MTRRKLSVGELERLTRRYTAEIFEVIGPNLDIPAPDVGTDARVMAWMMDTYSMKKGYVEPGVVTGKPIVLGGSLGREAATGRGIVVTTREALRDLGIPFEGVRVADPGIRERRLERCPAAGGGRREDRRRQRRPGRHLQAGRPRHPGVAALPLRARRGRRASPAASRSPTTSC